MYIQVEKSEFIDYKAVDRPKYDEEGWRMTWFDFWDKIEKAKLVKYMKENDLKLKPGLYKIRQAETFEFVRWRLRFEKIE